MMVSQVTAPTEQQQAAAATTAAVAWVSWESSRVLGTKHTHRKSGEQAGKLEPCARDRSLPLGALVFPDSQQSKKAEKPTGRGTAQGPDKARPQCLPLATLSSLTGLHVSSLPTLASASPPPPPSLLAARDAGQSQSPHLEADPKNQRELQIVLKTSKQGPGLRRQEGG